MRALNAENILAGALAIDLLQHLSAKIGNDSIMSLLREIQNEVASPDGDVASVLRKCKILAARLGSDEFAAWIDRELNGYPETQPTPDYRCVGAVCFANFMNIAWKATRQPVPLWLFSQEIVDTIYPNEFREGIAKLKSFIPNGARIDRPDLISEIEGKMYPQMHCSGVWVEISGSNIEQLISAVKTRILDFVLKIEAENPLAGEAPLNSQPVPKETVHTLVNNFLAPVGNLAQHSQDFSQTAEIGIQREDLVRLVTELTEHLDELHLGVGQKQKAEAQIATLRAQLTDEPNPIIVQQAGRTLRNIAEGAIGSLLATAAQPTVWQWIRQVLDQFPKS